MAKIDRILADITNPIGPEFMAPPQRSQPVIEEIST
jgi:hypothetical protein